MAKILSSFEISLEIEATEEFVILEMPEDAPIEEFTGDGSARNLLAFLLL